MPGSSIQPLYTRRAKLYQKFFIRFLQWEKVLEEFFQEYIYLEPGMKILDAGCGTGAVTKALHHTARERNLSRITFHGFDLTPAMLALFQEWINQAAVGEIQLQQANVLEMENQLPPGWNDYDLIVSSTMLEYIPREKLNHAITNLKNLLKNDGRLLIFITRKSFITKLVGVNWWRINPFSLDEIKMFLQQAGLSILSVNKLPSIWNRYLSAVEASFPQKQTNA
jgi:cyclopropane fatty-acyl-phospholipid synthase-like methyltransferase